MVLTTNFIKTIAAYILHWYQSGTARNYSIVNHQGNTVTFDILQSLSSMSQQDTQTKLLYLCLYKASPSGNAIASDVPNGGGGGSFIAVGSGSTEATKDDYTLESEITSLTVSSYTFGATASGVQYTSVMTNPTNSDVIIREIGIFEKMDINSTYLPAHCCMFGREVLENPITLAPGQSATFTAELTFV